MKGLKSLGKIDGPILVFGGVYSNLQAIQALKSKADEFGIGTSNVVCTGDVVGYCAQPEEVIKEIKNWGIHVISGNVEQQIASGQTDCGCDFKEGGRCDIFSRQWFPYACEQVSKDSIQWMSELPEFLEFDHHGKRVFVVHGSYFETSEYVFKSTDWGRKAKNFQEAESDIILAGHSGLPFKDVRNGKSWFNTGALGMPANDATTDVWYGILSEGKMELKPLSYDFQSTSDKMIQAGLPKTYAKTLITGAWDNCEILPEVETGQALSRPWVHER